MPVWFMFRLKVKVRFKYGSMFIWGMGSVKSSIRFRVICDGLVRALFKRPRFGLTPVQMIVNWPCKIQDWVNHNIEV